MLYNICFLCNHIKQITNFVKKLKLMTLQEIKDFNEKSNDLFFPLILTESADNLHAVFFLATRKVRFKNHSRIEVFSKFKNNRKKLFEIVSGKSDIFSLIKLK